MAFCVVRLMMLVFNLKGNVMKTGLIAVMLMVSTTWVIGGMTPQPQLGSTVCDAEAATVVGGCMAYGSGSCATTGSCSSTSIVYFSGNGNYKQDGTVNCGGSSACVSYSKSAKKCGG
jgi:hypothetical protein